MSRAKRYSKRIRMYRDGYVSVCIYLNVMNDGSKFYDTVIFRKIKKGNNCNWERGANLKPYDIPILLKLLKEAEEFLNTEIQSTPAEHPSISLT